MQQPAKGKVRPFPKPKAAGGDCPHCEAWEVREDDLYCGFCGSLLLDVTVVPSEVSLVDRLSPRKILVLSNDSDKPVQIHIVPVGRPLPGLLFEPDKPTKVEAGKKRSLKVSLDSEKLPEDLTVEKAEFLCRIDKDRRKVFPIRVTVRSAPRPELLTREVLFGRIEEGKSARGQIRLRNAGGLPLSLKQVEPVGSRQLILRSTPPQRIDVGETVGIDVAWDASREDDEMPGEHVGFRLAFVNSDDIFVPARAKLYRLLLHLDKTEIRVDPAVSKREYCETLKLENRGMVDIGVGEIDSDQPWVEVLATRAPFNLKARESVTDEEADSEILPKYLPEIEGPERVMILLRPKGLEPGLHEGEIRVGGLRRDEGPLATVSVQVNVVEMHPYEDYLGIDFGTTNSVISYLDPERQEPVLIADSEVGADALPHLVPSILVFRHGLQDYLIGREARHRMAAYSENTVRSVKRLLGLRAQHQFFEKEIGASRIVGLILNRLVERAELQLFQATEKYPDVQRAIVTVPANFFGAQIWGILQACEQAGLEIEASSESSSTEEHPGIILDEPSAAALYYLSRLETLGGAELRRKTKRKRGLCLLVFDYGGGTLDVSVAQVKAGEEEEEYHLAILASEGDDEIGGDQIDLAIMKRLLQEASGLGDFELDSELISCSYRTLQTRKEKESWSAAIRARVHDARRIWKDEAEKVKIALAQDQDTISVEIPQEAVLRIEGGKITDSSSPVTLRLPRGDVLDLVQPFLETAKELVRRTLRSAKVKLAEVDYVLHTGRQSLMKEVRERVRTLFPKLDDNAHILDDNVKICVAKGAALYGTLKDAAGAGGLQFLNKGRTIPCSYGYERRHGIAQRLFTNVIPKGSPYPTKQQVEVPAKQIRGRRLKIYQNRGTTKRIPGNPEIQLLGQARLEIDEGDACKVVFSVDANRNLEVLANGKALPIDLDAQAPEPEEWLW